MKETAKLIELSRKSVMNTYTRPEIVIARGKGLRCWDLEGREYLDFTAGIAVNALGHCHPAMVEAISRQSATLIHCSNLYYNEPQIRLAGMLSELSGGRKVFLANSGTEANEGLLKLARKYQRKKGHPEKTGFVTFYNGFHGRTMGSLAATAQPKFQKDFEPLPAGFRYVPLNDFKALEGAVDDTTGGILLELIQGEGGVYVADREFVSKVRDLCQKRGILLLVDEVQTGLGRTGSLFAYQDYGIQPDIVTVGKGLGGGFPIATILATDEVASAFEPGDHGTTFGGSPLATATALAVLKTVVEIDAPRRAAEMGEYLVKRLRELQEDHPVIVDVRGKGLLVGAEVSAAGKEIVDACLEAGLLLNCTAGKVLRFIPPLIVKREDIDEAIAILDRVLSAVETTLSV